VQGGRAYNACTPIVDGHKVIFSGAGRGTKAVALEAMGDKLDAKELWSNPDNSVQFNTPVVKNELIFGISDKDKLFCLSAETGKTEWASDIKGTRGYGSIVDAGPALLAITPKSDLIVFEPNGKEFKTIANYKVAESDVYAYPVVSGRRIFIKDRDSVTLWTIP
jgi:outer membrane protein assembly factor BamB